MNLAQWNGPRELLVCSCVCIALCTIVAHNIAQNRPDSFPRYPPDNHHISDDVYLREGGSKNKFSDKWYTANTAAGYDKYARVTIDKQTHSVRTVNSTHLQCAATQPTISTPAADAHTTPQTNRPTTPNPKITLTPLKTPPITQFASLRSIRRIRQTLFFLFGR